MTLLFLLSGTRKILKSSLHHPRPGRQDRARGAAAEERHLPRKPRQPSRGLRQTWSCGPWAGQHQLDRDRSLSVTAVVTVTERLQITNQKAEARAAALLLAPGFSYQQAAGSATVRAQHNAEEVVVVVQVRPMNYILRGRGCCVVTCSM